MSLREKLMEDMKQAMRDREAGKRRLSVIRMIRSAIRNAEIEKGEDFDEEQIIEVIAREAKQKRETLQAFKDAGREEKVRELEVELEVLESYLPEQLSEEELRELATEVIEQVNAGGPEDLGKVMGRLMPRVKGQAEGAVVNRIVHELLQE